MVKEEYLQKAEVLIPSLYSAVQQEDHCGEIRRKRYGGR